MWTTLRAGRVTPQRSRMPANPRQPLPRCLEDTAFTVAQGRSTGLGRSRMRGNDLARPFHGVRVAAANPLPGPGADPAPSDERVLQGRCIALLVALPPTAFFSHLTAARLWPLPLPSAASDEPIHACVWAPARSPRRPGVVGHQVRDPSTKVVFRGGLPLVDPATLFCQLATLLSIPDLVAIGDALVHRPVYPEFGSDRPWLSPAELDERVGRYRGRGKRSAALALTRIRPGAESRPETLLRLALVDAGLPEPEVNGEIRDVHGRFLARGDLLYREWKVLVEYDGEQHRTSTQQYDRDLARLDDLAADGWRVIRVVSRSFFADRRGTADRVAAALTERGWRG